MAESSSDANENKTGKKKTEENANASPKKGIKLSDLKVVDLRAELENRDLDKTGVKASLVERLRKALTEEGHEPDDYLFDMGKKGVKPEDGMELEENSFDAGKKNAKAEESEDDDDKQNDDAIIDKNESENGEILQVSLDDKEANLDCKDSIDTQGKSDGEDAENASDSFSKTEEQEKITKEAEKIESSPQPAAKAKIDVKKTLAKEKDVPPKNIWITGLSAATRAADLKALFSKQGKVVSVKIVTNAKQVSGEKKYYGFITMSTNKDAVKAVDELQNCELNEQVVSLELTPYQPGSLLKRAAIKPTVKKAKAIGESSKTATVKPKKDDEKSAAKSGAEESEDRPRDRSSSYSRRDRSRRSHERDYREYRGSFRRPFGGYRGRGRGGRGGFSFRERQTESFRRPFGRRPYFGRMSYRPPAKPGFMSYKMREERERLMNRDRFREREIRESERRRAQEAFRHKLIERKHREEAYRLEREKVQLRIEREMLERERAEILKLEREKQRIERERLEREKEKLRRQTQMREATKRPFPGPPGDGDSVWEKEKRARHYDSRYQGYPSKPPGMEGNRPEFREPMPAPYRHKFESRPEHYERDSHGPSTSRPDFMKYGKEKSEMRDHDERRVYKRNYFKEDPASGRPYVSRETDRYPMPPDDRFKRRISDMRSPRSRGGGGGSGRRMSFY